MYCYEEASLLWHNNTGLPSIHGVVVKLQILVVMKVLKTLDTIGNSQRLVFSLGVSQHMHKILNL